MILIIIEIAVLPEDSCFFCVLNLYEVIDGVQISLVIACGVPIVESLVDDGGEVLRGGE